MLSLKLVRGAENAEGAQPVVHVPPQQARFVIGRDPACDWPIPDKHLALSARHCEIVRVEGRQVLRDTSTNGTFVNDSRERLPADHLLRHGDRLRLAGFTVEVSVVPDSAAVATPVAPAAASPAPARRGGDPAAMVGADWERVAVRVGSAPVDAKTGFTRISKPPPKEVVQELLAAAPRAEAAGAGAGPAVGVGVGVAGGGAAAPPAAGKAEAANGAAAGPALQPVAQPAQPASPNAGLGSSDVLVRLAVALGVPVEALGTTDPALAAHRVASLLRVAVWTLHHQLGEQAQQLHAMGSRLPLTLGRAEAAPLRLAPGREAAVAALLSAGKDGESMLLMAVKELGQHAQRLLAAFDATGQRLGEQLAPAELERMAHGSGDPAAVWKTYSSLWTALGTGVGKNWSEGCAATARAWLAAAYDDRRSAERPGVDKPAR